MNKKEISNPAAFDYSEVTVEPFVISTQTWVINRA
jgi:hypothetical protein